ncbi:MAG: hypothetical protein M3010_10845 [Candidatus Dormibacteraeota bacterium]|nr:hypothetical protein [Candidatus Dormibacteraeota bacterium]
MSQEPPEPPGDAEPKPLEVPLEEQIGNLPPLQYPGGSREEDPGGGASAKRRGRIRAEASGGALILLVTAVGSLVTGRTAIFVLGLFAVAALAAYEFLVASFE